MRYKAAVFDLFNTLVDEASQDEYQHNLSQMASVLGAPALDFARLWRETFLKRNNGTFSTIGANIEHICQALGLKCESDRTARAARIRIEFTRGMLTPRPDAVDTLLQLNGMGHKVGLISNSSPEVPLLWPETPLAPLVSVTMFSCTEGIRKPDERIYRLACERLGVIPEDCLYIGDGSSNELTGAAQVGMHATLIRVGHESTIVDTEADSWQGPTITSLAEVLAFAEVSA